MADLNEQSFSLNYLERFDIRNNEEGLNEPSGLTLSYAKTALWTISDEEARLYVFDIR